ncbi:MAG TPA: hypothetical protein VKU19_01210 [Bryobacteraceae bacterium]|nr:hypothetical protein [Bryobacteraceae bacterium]
MSGLVYSVFEWASIVGLLLLAVRLYQTRLNKRYPVFFAYVLFRLPMAVLVLSLPLSSNTYFYFWVFTEPFVWLFYVWVVLELFRLSLSRHRGLYTLGKWAMYVGMVISVFISILLVLPKMKPTPDSRLVGYMMGADRGITLSLAIFVILMLFLLTRYPVPLSRNVVLHVTLYTVFFLSNTLTVLAQSVFGLHLYMPIDLGLLGISTICVMAWLCFLAPEGEDVRVNIPHLAPENEQRLLGHLDALNATLLKAAQK